MSESTFPYDILYLDVFNCMHTTDQASKYSYMELYISRIKRNLCELLLEGPRLVAYAHYNVIKKVFNDQFNFFRSEVHLKP